MAETITAIATTTNLSSLISNMEAETIVPKEAGIRAEAGRHRRQPSDRERRGEEGPLEDVTMGAMTIAAAEIRAMETATDLAGATQEVAVATHETAGALPQRRGREVHRHPPRLEVGPRHRRHHRCTVVVAVVVDRGVTHRLLQAAVEVATTTRGVATTSPNPRIAAAVLDHRRAKAEAATAATAAAEAAASPTAADERLSCLSLAHGVRCTGGLPECVLLRAMNPFYDGVSECLDVLC